MEFIDSKANEEKQGLGADRGGLRPLVHGRGVRLGLLPERQPLRARHGRLHARGRDGRPLVDPRRARRHDRRDAQGTRGLPGHGRGRLDLRRPGHPVRHDHQRLAHERQLGPHLRVQPVLGIHVPQRHGLQPGLAEPHEVRPGRRRVRYRGLRLRRSADDHGAGDPGRQRQLPDAQDRGELPPLPTAGPGLRQPRAPCS